MQDSNGYTRMSISFTEADEDLIAFLKPLKKSNKASEFIRDAIREKISRQNESSKCDLPENKKDVEDIVRSVLAEILDKKQIDSALDDNETLESDLDTQPKQKIPKVDEDILNAINQSFDF